MAKKTAYQQANEDIAAIIAEAKIRKGWMDRDVGKILSLTACTISRKRSKKELPELSFSGVILLADAAGYDVKFQKREVFK